MRAAANPLFAGLSIHAIISVQPEPHQMKELVESGSGKYLSLAPHQGFPRVLVVSCEEDVVAVGFKLIKYQS